MHIHIEVEREEDGRWIAEATDLPGVIVYGDDRASAVAKAEALAIAFSRNGWKKAEAYLRDRAARGSRAAYDAALAEVPDVEPEAYDRLADAAALLDPAEERALAEEGLAADFEAWPEYSDGDRENPSARAEEEEREVTARLDVYGSEASSLDAVLRRAQRRSIDGPPANPEQ
jgi:hypothetical protein